MQAEDFTEETALAAAQELRAVLAQRTHQKKVMGQIVTVSGQLGSALKLDQIINQLNGKTRTRKANGLVAFIELWETLSERTRNQVLKRVGWYNPEELDWDDKRSNRLPSKPDQI